MLNKMTNLLALRILHPSTTVEALAEIEYYSGFKGDEAVIKACEEACIFACLALEKQIPKVVTEIHVDEYYCPNCGSENMCDQGIVTDEYCPNCGQALICEKEVKSNED